MKSALAEKGLIGGVYVTRHNIEGRGAGALRSEISRLIRRHWGFQGIVITDDLVMGPIYEHGVCVSVTEALNAGVDLLLVAYDGLQFYHIFHCALSASADGRLMKRC